MVGVENKNGALTVCCNDQNWLVLALWQPTICPRAHVVAFYFI